MVDALRANLSVRQLAHISSLTFALLFNHNQPVMHSEMSHIPTLRIDAYIFAVGFVTNETVFGKRYNTHNCSVPVNNETLCAAIHSETGKCDQNNYLFVIALMFPPAAARSNETATVKDIRGFRGKYLHNHLMLTFALNLLFTAVHPRELI